VDGAVLGREAFALRFFGENGDDRLLIVNLGEDLHLEPAPEPLLAPLEGTHWKMKWSSESPRYGGSGMRPPKEKGRWTITGHCAVVMEPAKRKS
jgi:maltooligosyltrehalose trehalohydrolase